MGWPLGYRRSLQYRTVALQNLLVFQIARMRQKEKPGQKIKEKVDFFSLPSNIQTTVKLFQQNKRAIGYFCSLSFILTKPLQYMTNEQILGALRNVQEPDLGKDIVTLGMVKDININDKKLKKAPK